MHTTDEMHRVGLAANYGGKLAGVLTATIFQATATKRGYMVVSCLAVSARAMRLGLGTRLLRRACQRIVTYRVDVLVPDSNLPAQLFFKACGFKATAAGVKVRGVESDFIAFDLNSVDDLEKAVAKRVTGYDAREGVMYAGLPVVN